MTRAAALLVTAPASAIADVAPLVEAGADELYCGHIPPAWVERYGLVGSPNRRYEAAAQMPSLDDVARAADLAHERSVPLFAALNAHVYVEGQYDLLEPLVDGLVAAGVDGLLVADLGLALWLRGRPNTPRIILSTGTSVMNPRAAAFLARATGAERIVLPRHMTAGEVRGIVASTPGVAFESFVINEPCANEDGLCTFAHGLADLTGDELNACDLLWETRVVSAERDPAVLRSVRVRASRAGRRAGWCGACSLFDLARAGVAAVKVSGRGIPLAGRVRDVALIAGLARFLAAERPTRDAFAEEARRRRRALFRARCDPLACGA